HTLPHSSLSLHDALPILPGPAERDATDATISAYGTGTTQETACTIGTVAWAPQLIMLMFGESRWACRLTGGHTGGPRAAGVRSIDRKSTRLNSSHQINSY